MDKVDVLKNIIYSRKSTFPKQYLEGNLPVEIITDILEVGSIAPNHKKTKPWKYQFFEGDLKNELGAFLANLYRETSSESNFLEKKYLDIKQKCSQSAAIISISMSVSPLVPEWEEVAAVAMGVQNMYLMCAAHNVGCYWSSPSYKDMANKFLSLNDDEKCLGFFYLGKIV